MDVMVRFEFNAAHRLPEHAGRCVRMHGHTYVLEVVASGHPSARTGMVVDFFEVEDLVGRVLNPLRDSCLNDILATPTAEAVVVWLWRRLKPGLAQLAELRLWETPDCHVSYRGEPVAAELLTPGVAGVHPSTAP